MPGTLPLRFTGHRFFRQRLVLATLSGRAIIIEGMHVEDIQEPGLRDYEVSFLRLLERCTHGSEVQVDHTGTRVSYRPGLLVGGFIEHACPTSRAIGYFLEFLIALAPFGKKPMHVKLTGITNDNVDPTVDTLRAVILPQMQWFGVEDDLELKILKRGAAPLGGGEVRFVCPILKKVSTLQMAEVGKIKKIRGIAYAARISPHMANRVADAARGLLTRFLPDVYVYTDVYKGADAGLSPGYGLTLICETQTGALISAECAYQPRSYIKDLGVRAARLLLREIQMGGAVATSSQWLVLLMMALGPEDVSTIRLGMLSNFTMQFLRDLRTFMNVTFKFTNTGKNGGVQASCFGTGFANISRRAA
ncbi:hypothetical protein CXG81DRAFT_8650 [Caulochytrium protostelioides]|uniref:18S rRNA biogenesis protein n=1 Tax=Caulochytrium protostelioides TaxID=1555241 RepID=A0A4P9XG20_9FUNG|nr:hypothetical protein CXG81DRAFT_8650 [Caulochytrium protostelioides]|eukprot:RKP04120.1 hypothetical protein CXG81DRAFT_8650 [Caulochytrium protostelioides]